MLTIKEKEKLIKLFKWAILTHIDNTNIPFYGEGELEEALKLACQSLIEEGMMVE